MSKPSLVVLIVEDDLHRMLIYRYLRLCGLLPRQIRTDSSPSGRGSAEQWIRKTYAAGVKAYRLRAAKAASALIVMIDADSHTVQGRLGQLSHELEAEGIHLVGDDEGIARLVPKRNVETWILSLIAHDVNEIDDYKHARNNWNDSIPPASERLYQLSRQAAVLPSQCIDSLRRGVNELVRLQF